MSSPVSTTSARSMDGKEQSSRSGSPPDGRGQGLASTGLADGLSPPEGALDVGPGWQIVAATAADHHPVHQLLTRVFQGPTLDAFNVSLEDPFYEPCDRLLVRVGEWYVAHALTSPREMYLGGLRVPATQISWLATLPEYRGKGFGHRLLRVAEAKMVQDGALLGLLTTGDPRFFAQEGWVLCGRVSRWLAGARNLLVRLGSEGNAKTGYIRPWRHVELPALVRLYAQNMDGTIGTFLRSEASWRWLIGRRAFDHVYVATESPGRSRLDDDSAHVVGYAFTRDDQVLELMVEPGRPDIAGQLLQRVCCDAIEMDCHHLALHAPPNEPLGDVFGSVGGHSEPSNQWHGDYVMVRVPDPRQVLHLLCGELHQRATAAKLERPCELGLAIDGEKIRLIISRRSVKVATGRLGRSYLRCEGDDFVRLLLGVLDIPAALGSERLETSTRLAVQTAAALFPRLPLWRPPLDDLME